MEPNTALTYSQSMRAWRRVAVVARATRGDARYARRAWSSRHPFISPPPLPLVKLDERPAPRPTRLTPRAEIAGGAKFRDSGRGPRHGPRVREYLRVQQGRISSRATRIAFAILARQAPGRYALVARGCSSGCSGSRGLAQHVRAGLRGLRGQLLHASDMCAPASRSPAQPRAPFAQRKELSSSPESAPPGPHHGRTAPGQRAEQREGRAGGRRGRRTDRYGSSSPVRRAWLQLQPAPALPAEPGRPASGAARPHQARALR